MVRGNCVVYTGAIYKTLREEQKKERTNERGADKRT